MITASRAKDVDLSHPGLPGGGEPIGIKVAAAFTIAPAPAKITRPGVAAVSGGLKMMAFALILVD
ncbi:hypothetical protein C7H85_14785 [Zobellella endophytica]|uniref:Uncharacterized protein n=1 Tax=Zobellella endophytica TaxID=2116700 RepID=A0A2P7R1B6_9GAMM|nr:hypothetical protein C7H85_14785 [Zobellella endophytica]